MYLEIQPYKNAIRIHRIVDSLMKFSVNIFIAFQPPALSVYARHVAVRMQV
jgi:hypothetical protein